MELTRENIGAYFGILAGILFVIITFGIMLIYPGGYSFIDNYISELGLSVTNGVPTMINWVLFATACTSAAVLIVPFWISIRTHFQESKIAKYLSILGTILGIIAAPFLAGVGIFAADLYGFQHGWSTVIFFILITVAITIYSIAILFNKGYNNIISLIGFIVATICLLYIFALGTPLMQKVAVYALVLYSVFQGFFMLKLSDQTTVQTPVETSQEPVES